MQNKKKMRILIISYFFPPFNAAGALRAGKMAKYLSLMGHDVRVLTATNQMLCKNLPVEIEEERIIRSRWVNVNRIIAFFLGGKEQIANKGYEEAKSLPNFLKKIGYFYKNYLNFPDAQIGWYPFAVREGKKLLDNWKADIIWSTSPPPTALLIAKKLSSIYKIPWTADFRDLWASNQNAELYYSQIRRILDRKLESSTLKSAKALITISEPLADILGSKFKKKIKVISNGYDLSDYPSIKANPKNNLKLNIIYTGTIFPKKENYHSFFEAISLLKNFSQKINVDFYGRGSSLIQKIAIKYNLESSIGYHNIVPYHESLYLQTNADLLLLLIHDSEKEKGTLPVKFFEYIGAKKPILLVGCTNGAAGDLIRSHELGLAENDPYKISDFLKKVLQKKIEKGNTIIPSTDSMTNLSRQEKAKELADFLKKCITI